MRILSVTEAETLASKFRYQEGLGQADPINAKTLIRKLNVTLVYRRLSESSFGISCRSGEKRFMLINSSSTRGRQHFTIAHELYHLYFDEAPTPHMCCGGPSIGEEKNANRFASALLMPREGVLSCVSGEEIADHTVSVATVFRMEQLFGVSHSTLLIRLKDLGLITSSRFEELDRLSVKETARAWGYDSLLYEAGNEGVVIGDFGEKARRLFESGKISEGHYYELMNILYGCRGEETEDCTGC